MAIFASFGVCGVRGPRVYRIPPRDQDKARCQASLQSSEPPPFLQRQSIRIVSYNLEDFREGAMSAHKEQGIRAALAAMDPDILVVQEVVSSQSLRYLAEEFLGGKYVYYYGSDLDHLNFNVGILVRKSLGLVAGRMKIFGEQRNLAAPRLVTRNIPVLPLYLSSSPQMDPHPVMVLAGVHLRSQRDAQGDPTGLKRRTNDFDFLIKTMKLWNARSPMAVHGGVPWVVAGDFNGDVDADPEFARRDGVTLTSALPYMGVSHLEGVTCTYHPHRRETVYCKFDHVLVQEQFREALTQAFVYRYRVDGREKPLPMYLPQRKENPSDHFPVVVDLDVPRWLKALGLADRWGVRGAERGDE